jgi:IQ calmodulin-binding motif-containing protein
MATLRHARDTAAAIVLQAAVRAFVARKQYIAVKSAAVTLQVPECTDPHILITVPALCAI